MCCVPGNLLADLLVCQHCLEIRLGILVVRLFDLVFINEYLEYRWGDECRQVCSKTNVLNVEVQQRQEDCNGLLFEPRDGERQRQRVHISLECPGQCNGNLDARISIVTLTQVQHAGNTTD